MNKVHDFLFPQSQVVNFVLKFVELFLHLDVLALDLVEFSRLGQVHIYRLKVAPLTLRFLHEWRSHGR